MAKKTISKNNKLCIDLTDIHHVMGMGSVEIHENMRFVRINKEYLKRAIKCIGDFDPSAKSIVLGMHLEKEYFLSIGNINEGKNRFSGMIIAPQVEDE